MKFKILIERILERNNRMMIVYDTPEKKEIISLIRKVRKKRALFMRTYEAYQLFTAVKSVTKINGDIAEVGVAQGSSARLICEAKSDKHLYLFDTFEGLPEPDKKDHPRFVKGQYVSSLDSVKEYLRDYPNVHFFKGIFPSTAESIKDKTFSFINFDVDLHKSVYACLDFFYPRMNKGGIILSHDYPYAKDVINDFFKDKPEPVIELSGNHCIVIKC